MLKRAKFLLFVLSVCLSGCAASTAMLSYCNPASSAVLDQSNVLRLLTLNTAHGRSTSFNQMLLGEARLRSNLDQIAALLKERNADVTALQETDAVSKWSGKFNHVDHLRENAGYGCSVLGLHVDSWIASYGTALLSGAKMHSPESIPFKPSPPTTNKGFVRTTLNWQQGERVIPVVVLSVHLDYSRKSVRDRQVATIIENLAGVTSPIVLMGDLNSRWEERRSHVKQLAEALELNVFEPDNRASLGTYKSPSGRRLDWIITSRDLVFTRYEVLPDVVSDHFAVYAEVSYEP